MRRTRAPAAHRLTSPPLVPWSPLLEPWFFAMRFGCRLIFTPPANLSAEGYEAFLAYEVERATGFHLASFANVYGEASSTRAGP